jgi:hypothetical protein
MSGSRLGIAILLKENFLIIIPDKAFVNFSTVIPLVSGRIPRRSVKISTSLESGLFRTKKLPQVQHYVVEKAQGLEKYARTSCCALTYQLHDTSNPVYIFPDPVTPVKRFGIDAGLLCRS